MAVDPELLYQVLCRSYSATAAERQQAETFLAEADRSPGFPVALLRVAVEQRAELEARQAAAIQLRGTVRRWWAPVGDSAGRGYGDADKAAVRSGLLEGVRSNAGVQAIRAQLVETFKLVASHDFPGDWPGLVEQLLAGLRSDDMQQTYCSLILVRRLFKQLESRPTSRRDELLALNAAVLPVLKALAPALAGTAAHPGPHRLEGVEMIKVIFKCFYSAFHTGVCPHVQQDIRDWMQLLLATADSLSMAPGQPEQEAVTVAKCRKWVFHIFFRLCARHGNARRCVNGGEAFAEAWSAEFAAPVAGACLAEACSPHRGPEQPPACKRPAALALLCICELCSKEATFAALKPRLPELLESGIFRWARFSGEDLRVWQEDPEEFVRRSFDDIATMHEPRAAALEVVERLLRHRSDAVVAPLLHFCRTHLDAQAQNPTDPELCASKDGALLLLGSMVDELRRLDPAQAKKKKAKAKSGVAGISIEDLLGNYVRPDLTSSVAFLRLRACWVYEKVAAKAPRLGPAGAATDALRAIVGLTGDAELPVRVRACTSLEAFLARDRDEEVRAAIVGSLGQLMERLLQILSEVQCEEIAGALEMLVNQFPQEITPYAAQLVAQLASQVCQLLEASAAAEAQRRGGDDDNEDLSVSRRLETILGVCQACTGEVGAVSTEEEQQKRMALFAGLAEPMVPVLGKLLHPDGVDHMDEACEMLSFLTFYGPSPLPACLWSLFPRLYQCICGGSTASLPLPPAVQDGWAPDYITNLLPALQNFVARGPPEAFMAGTWAEVGRTYPEMLFAMSTKVLRMPGLGAERDCAAGARLAASVFENVAAPAADALLAPWLGELWRRFEAAETAALQRAALHTLGAMAWYSPEALLRSTEEKGCSQQVFQAWLQHSKSLKTKRDKKLFILGLSRVFQLACVNSLPASLAQGLPQIVQQLAAQSKELIQLRVKQDASAEEEQDSDDDSDVDEEKIAQVLRKLEQTPDPADAGGDEEEDDDEDEDDACVDSRDGASIEARASRIEAVEELAFLRQTLQQAPQAVQQQVSAWVGSSIESWAAELKSEEHRVAAAGPGAARFAPPQR